MKNFLSNLWSRVAGSQRNDVEFDRRLTVGSPSGFTMNWTLKLVSVLVLVLTIGIGNAWGTATTLAGWTFTSGSAGTNYPNNKSNFTATTGTMKTSSTFYLNGSGSTWNSTKATYAFTAVKDITITLTLNQAVPQGTVFTLSAATYYNKAKNAPMTGFTITAKEGSGSYAATGVGTTSWSLSTSSATKTTTYTTQAALASGTAIAFKLTGTGKAGSGEGYMNNITISATTYSVTYNGNSNTGGSVPTDNVKYITGGTVTVKANSGSLTKTGYTFSGWNTNSSGTGTNYTAGSGTFTITANTTLYAKWESAGGCPTPPTVGTASNSSVGVTGATVTCASITKGSCDIEEWGFVYGTSSYPTGNVTKKSASASATNVGEYSHTFTSLDPNTTYYVRGYAKVGEDTYYGTQTSFTTKKLTEATSNSSYGTVTRSGRVITGSPKSGYTYGSPAYSVSGGSGGSSTTVSQSSNAFTVTSNSTSDITVTINFVTIPVDHFIDAVHNTSGYTGEGMSKSGNYSGSKPTIADKTAKTSGTCEEVHYHFAGWVAAAYKDSPSGHIATITGIADNTTYYAVWEQEDDGSGAAPVNTILFSEAWTGVENNVTISEPSANGSSVYGGASISYTWTNGGSTTQTYTSDGPNGNENILISYNNGIWKASGIPTGYAATMTFTYAMSGSGTLAVSSPTSGITVSGSASGSSITVTSGVAAFDLEFKNTHASKNLRLDDILVKVSTKGKCFDDPITECEPVTCSAPISPTNGTPTAYGTTIGWTESASEGTLDYYEYAVWENGATEPTSGYTNNAKATSVTLSGLRSHTTYHWKVRRVCTGDDGESTWLKSSFTTSDVTLSFSVPSGVPAVAGQSSSSSLPSADVPTNCGDCWTFAGWTPQATYTGNSTPSTFFAYGEYAHVSSAEGTTLYAVYQKSAYRIISSLSDIVEDEYYVFTLSDFGVDGAMTSTVTGTYYTSSVDVAIKEDENGTLIENPTSSAIWKFSGTTSTGLFKNIASYKYIDLSSTSSPVAASTTDNLTITVYNESKKQFNIRSNATVNNYLQVYEGNMWGVDDDHDGYYSARIFKRAESTYSTEPSCPNFIVTFDKNGGTTHGTKYVTACEGYLSTLPSDPADNTLGCAEAFVGWSATELTGTGNDEPEDLFSDVAYSPQIKGNTTFYAVFASKVAGLSGKYTLDYSEETSLSSSSSWNYGSALAYTAKDGSSWTVKAYKNSGMQINKGKNSSIKIPNCPSGATITTIAITCSGSTNAVGFSASDYSGSGTISYLAEAESGTSQTLDLRGLEVTGGYIVPDGGTAVITKIVVNYAAYEDYMTYCTKAYNDATNDHKWSTSGNWIGGVVPAINERALINKQVVVDVATAKAKEVVLNQSSTNTGSMEISAGKALTVAETVQKTTDGSTLVATGENDIVFGSTLAAGTGALVAGGYTSGDNKATVNFAVKAKKDGSGHWINQYIGTPFNDQGAVLYNYYGTQLYAFHPTNDGNYDSGTGSANDAWWSRLAETDGMNPFVGYNILCSKAETPVLWMQGTLNASDNQTINGSKLVYNGTSNTENLLANSWMAPIHIEAFENGDFSNVEKTIYIFNAGSPEDYESAGDGTASATAAGQYIVLPIASAPWLNPTVRVIPAMQAFSVYATGANPSLTLDYNRLVYTPALTSVGVVPTRAPRRNKVAEDAPEVISLHVTAGSGYAANAYILGREDFADSFDDGWDGRFMEGDEAAPQLYAPTENGNLVINCVPNIEGTVVCFKRGSVDSEYTFTFSYEGEESWYLNDQKEQESTLISALDSYTFHSSADDMPARFVVSRTPIYKTPTGVENADGRNQKSDVRKIVIDDHVFIIRNGLMYDVTGALCK